jgi:hypothetical protein
VRIAAILALGLAAIAGPAAAQLKDEPPAERDAMVMGALLPGAYGNGEQVAFDVRLRTPAEERAGPMRITVGRLTALGGEAFVVRRAGAPTIVYAPRLDAGARTVRLAAHLGPENASDVDLSAAGGVQAAPACDLFAAREAGQFRAVTRGSGCVQGPAELLIAERALWWRPAAGAPFARLNRARAFECLIDMPGSGGINGEAFNRYDGLMLDDQGGEAWITTKEATPRRLGLRLRAVDWPMNNKKGTFTRDSLTLYLIEPGVDANAPAKLVTYAWTEPGARRIGLNTIWLLANCFMESNAAARPEF